MLKISITMLSAMCQSLCRIILWMLRYHVVWCMLYGDPLSLSRLRAVLHFTLGSRQDGREIGTPSKFRRKGKLGKFRKIVGSCFHLWWSLNTGTMVTLWLPVRLFPFPTVSVQFRSEAWSILGLPQNPAKVFCESSWFNKFNFFQVSKEKAPTVSSF